MGLPKRWRRGGRTLAHHLLLQQSTQRLWSLIMAACIVGTIPQGPGIPELEKPCLEWIGPTQQGGYGMFTLHGNVWRGGESVRVGSTMNAHRVIWYAVHGSIRPSLVVHHVCLNPSCCEPTHLRLLTPEKHRQLHRKLPRGKRLGKYVPSQRPQRNGEAEQVA